MIIRKNLPSKNYTKLDNKVFIHPDLSDGAKVLYGYLASLRNGQDYVDAYLMNALQVSQDVITRRKRELKKADLILLDKTGYRTHVIYIGSTQFKASDVKIHWDKIDKGEM